MEQIRPPQRRLGVEARREEILGSATSAFAATPYDQVSVAAVAAAAGASEGLVHKYFDGKAGLYTDVVRAQLERLAERRRDADSALPPNTSARDRVRTSIETVLDHVAESGAGWATPFFSGPSEPEPVQALRRDYRSRFVGELRDRLEHEGRRDRYALTGFLGFLDACSRDWAAAGCPSEDRPPLVTAALGALQGALGDWGALKPTPDR